VLKAHKFFFYDNDKYLIIILEYCPQGSLKNFIGKMSNIKVRTAIEEIAEGLVYLHSKNIIHRDIKPENIMILDDVVKIADFGTSKILGNVSKALTCIGTSYYMAREMI
jgi:serine/threonine protein kinase